METYLSPEQVTEIVPGITVGGLAQMRFHGTGPRYIKPSPKKVIYALTDVIAWLEESKRTSTREAVSA